MGKEKDMKNDSCKIRSIQNSKSWKLHPFGFSKVKRHPFAGSKCHHETSLACLELNDVFTKKHLEHQGGTTGYCDCTGIAEGISEVHDLPQDPQWKHIFFVIYCTFAPIPWRHRKLSDMELTPASQHQQLSCWFEGLVVEFTPFRTFVDFMAAGALACGFYRFCEFLGQQAAGPCDKNRGTQNMTSSR